MRNSTLILLSISCLTYLFHGCQLDKIAPAALADFEVLGGPTHIQGETITFENTSKYTEGASFTWDMGDETVIETGSTNSITHTYDAAGSYTIKLTAHKATIEGEDPYSTTKDTTITISAAALPDPIPAFTATPDSSPCIAPCLVRFVDQSQHHDSTKNVWDFGDMMGTSGETSPSYTYDSPGMYTPSLTVVNAQGVMKSIERETPIIVINPEEPMPVARFSMDNPDGCVEAPCTFVLTNTSVDADSFFWDFYADGSTDVITTDLDTVQFYTERWGLIYVKLIAKNNGGNMDMYMDSTFLATPDTPRAFFRIDVDPCTAPCDAVFSNFSQGANFIEMDYGDGTPPITETVKPDYFHTYTDTGMYIVTMTATKNNSPYVDTHTDTIHVIAAPALPVANFTCTIQGNTVTFTNLSQHAVNYVWDFGDGSAASTDSFPQHTYSDFGTYTVELTAFNSTGEYDTATKTITILCTDPTYERKIGTPARERILAVAAHPDGGFVFTGSTVGNSFGIDEAGWLVHVDECGDTLWTKEYTLHNLNSTSTNRFHSIIPRADGGGFILGGYAEADTSAPRDGWILKINNDGSEVWNQAVNHLNWHSLHIEEIIENPNTPNGYLATGRASEFPAIPNTSIQDRDGFIIQISDLGMSASTTTHIIEDQILNPYLESYFKAMYANSSGDVFLAGHLRPSTANTDWQARFVRYNLASNTIVVDTAFGDLNEDEQLFDIIEDPSGDFVMCGSHNSTNFWMLKMDAMGSNLVEGTINLTESSSTAENITMTQNGTQYALTGFARNSGVRQAFLIVVNLSMNTLFINRRYGTSGDDRGREIILAPDGGYFIGGEGDNGPNGKDAFYIRTDINGLTL